MIAARGQYGCLAFQFGGTVYIQGSRRIGLYPGLTPTAIKYVVGRVMDQPGAKLMAFTSQCSGSQSIDDTNALRLAFSLVHRGMRSGIHDHIRSDCSNRFGDAIKPGKITAQFLAVEI